MSHPKRGSLTCIPGVDLYPRPRGVDSYPVPPLNLIGLWLCTKYQVNQSTAKRQSIAKKLRHELLNIKKKNCTF